MNPPQIQNQAIATIPVTITPDGAVINCKTIKTMIHPRLKRWLAAHHLPLTYQTNVRAWPRTTKDGAIRSLTLISLNTTEGQNSIISGRVVYSKGDRIAINIKPIRDRVKPFTITVLHSLPNPPRFGHHVRLDCAFVDGHFRVVEVQTLKGSKPKLTSKPKPKQSKPTPAQLERQKQAQELLARAAIASDPRHRQQLETLAQQLMSIAA